MLATLAGIVGAKLAPDEQLATLPVAAAIVGVALCAFPTSVLIRRCGRRLVFIGGLLLASAGALLAAYAITISSFVLFAGGCFLLGCNMAVVAQYRFAAAESVPAEMTSQAVSAIMLGTLAATIVMPWVAVRFRHLLDVEFSGSFVVAPVLFLAAALIFVWLPLPRSDAGNDHEEKSFDVRQALRRRDVQLAVVAGTVGFGVMSLVMTAAPVSMHMLDGHSVESTADVIRAHILAMYAPSLFSGWLIARLGLRKMLWAGLMLEALSIGIATTGQDAWHYGTAMVLLGAGWNLLYVGGTTLLATTCRGPGATRMQGTNDLIMFGTTGICSLSAGALLYRGGWVGMNLAASLLLILVIIAIIRDAPNSAKAANG